MPAFVRNHRPLNRLFILLLIGFLPGGALAGQDTLRILAPDGEPVPFATLYQKTNDAVIGQTDVGGRIVLSEKEVGFGGIRIEALGYGRQETTLVLLRKRGMTYRMSAQSVLLVEAIVVGRRDEAWDEINQQVKTIDQDEIARVQALSTTDALADAGGVYVQKSQFGGGSPVVRGFEANRVLLVVDGVRMNNAIYRNGHLQNAITVDPLALDRIEVLYGAGALAYGSDAIGGVVHFRTERPRFRAGTPDAVEGKIAMSYASAANAVSVGGKLGYGAENWAGLTLLSATSTSHLRAGAQRPDRYPGFGARNTFIERRNGVDVVVPNDRPNRQIGTAYDQYNLLQKFRFRLADRLELAANLQWSTSSDVPRYDALTERRNGELRWARWDYGPQTRALASLTLSDRRATRLYDVATYLLSYQRVKEDRIRRRFTDPLEENNLETVGAWNLQTDFSKQLSGLLTLRYGADLRYDDVASDAFFRNVDTGEKATGLATRYPSAGSSLLAAGAYAEARYELSTDWALRGGLRVSRQRLRAAFGPDDPIDWPQAYVDGIDNTESAAVFSAGLRGKRLRLLYAQGFRAPNLDDFAKFRERNGFIQIPNPALQPERSHTLEAGYRLADRKTNGARLNAEITAYHTWLRNAIIRGPGFLPDGSAILETGGDILLAQTNVNAATARVFGADVVLRWTVSPRWEVHTDAHWLRGRRRQDFLGRTFDLPQDHIPPAYGSTTFTWRQKEKWRLGLRFRYQAAKAVDDYAVSDVISGVDGLFFDRTGTSDNFERTPFDPATGTFAGTPAWWTANLFAEFTPDENWSLRLKADNLLDRHYRTFASGLSAPGLDLGAGITRRF